MGAEQFNDEEGFEMDIEPDLGKFTIPAFLKVYLACPLTNNNPKEIEQSKLIRGCIKSVLKSNPTAALEVYDPGDITAPGSDHTADEVYQIDRDHTLFSDLVIFCSTGPSTGMGVEAQIAAEGTVPRVVIAPLNDLSRMFTGSPARILATILYRDISDLEARLSAELPKIVSHALQSAQRRRPILEAACQVNFGRFLVRRRIVMRLSVEQLSFAVDLSPGFLLNLERNPKAYVGLSPMIIERFSQVLNCQLDAPDGRLNLKAKDDHLAGDPAVVRDSLNSLVDFLMDIPKPDDERVFRMWDEYATSAREQYSVAIAGREALNTSVTSNEWRIRYHRLFL